MPARIPDHVRAAILDDVRAGQKSRAQIGRDHEVAPSTVGVIAKEAGITDAFARTQTKKATAARLADNAQRRATIASRLLHLGEAAVAQTEAYLVAASAVQAATIAAIALDKHLALDRHDAEAGGSDVDRWLETMAGGSE